MVECKPVKTWRAFPALTLILGACASSSSVAGVTATGTTSGVATGATSGGGTTGATSGGGTTGGITGGTIGGGTNGGSTSGSGDAGSLGNTVNGPYGFKVAFAGLLYDMNHSGQPDLTVVDCRLTDGVDQFSNCGIDGGPGPASENAVDLYLFNMPPVSSLTGTYTIGPPTDAGPYATLYRTQRDLDAGLLYTLQANQGMLQCLGWDAGATGTFQATFDLDGSYSSISGTFDVPYCGPIVGN
jgi:hypothetical protein